MVQSLPQNTHHAFSENAKEGILDNEGELDGKLVSEGMADNEEASDGKNVEVGAPLVDGSWD